MEHFGAFVGEAKLPGSKLEIHFQIFGNSLVLLQSFRCTCVGKVWHRVVVLIEIYVCLKAPIRIVVGMAAGWNRVGIVLDCKGGPPLTSLELHEMFKGGIGQLVEA